jgi:hypothetical protein
MKKNKICCIFINHTPDKYKDVYEKMSNSVDYIDFYNYNPNWNEIIDVYGDILFKDIYDQYNVASGNASFAAYYFKNFINSNYDYYFVFENDVIFTGDYKLFFDTLTKNIYNYDAILPDQIVVPEKDWYWINNPVAYRLIDGFTKDNCYKQLYTFFCLSNKMIDHIIEKYKEGYYGHQELIMSCIFKNYDGKYDYFSNHFNMVNSFLTWHIKPHHLKLKNTIIHPVKQ